MGHDVEARAGLTAETAVTRLPTWAWEQAALAALLVPGVLVAVSADRSALGVARAAAGALLALAAQKSRSGADRRREQDELRGVSAARLRCDRELGRWAAWSQVLGIAALVLAGLAAGSRWAYLAGALPAAYAYAYGAMWRPWWRRRRPARLDG